MLTKRQDEVHRFIYQFIKNNGWSPTLKQIREAIGVKGNGTVSKTLCRIEERGYIRRTPHLARSIEILIAPALLRPPRRKNSSPPSPGQWFTTEYDKTEQRQELVPMEDIA